MSVYVCAYVRVCVHVLSQGLNCRQDSHSLTCVSSRSNQFQNKWRKTVPVPVRVSTWGLTRCEGDQRPPVPTHFRYPGLQWYGTHRPQACLKHREACGLWVQSSGIQVIVAGPALEELRSVSTEVSRCHHIAFLIKTIQDKSTPQGCV